MELRWHLNRPPLRDGHSALKWIPTEQQVADGLTIRWTVSSSTDCITFLEFEVQGGCQKWKINDRKFK